MLQFPFCPKEPKSTHLYKQKCHQRKSESDIHICGYRPLPEDSERTSHQNVEKDGSYIRSKQLGISAEIFLRIIINLLNYELGCNLAFCFRDDFQTVPGAKCRLLQ